MRSLFHFITLKTFAVTAKRKRMFFIALLFISVLIGVDEHIVAKLEGLPLVPKLIELVMFALTAYLFTSAIRIITVSRYRKRSGLDPEENDNFTIGASTLVGTVTTIATIVWFFAIFEIEFYTFLTSIALFSVALATIFKDSIQNFLQGLFLLFTANYRVGDYIEVNNQPRGRIVDITLSKTKLQLANGSYLFVPNSTLNGTAVVNLSESPYAIIALSLSIPREVDIDAFTTTIKDLMKERFTQQFNERRTYLTITDASKESDLVVECGIAVKDFSFQLERNVKDAINKHVATLPRKKEEKKSKKKD